MCSGINIRYGHTDSLGNILGGLSVIKLTENNTRVRLAEIFDRLDNLTPKFIFGEFAIDYYVIRNVQNSSCVITSTKGSDYEVFVRDYKGSKTQKWVLEPLVDTHTHDWYGGAVTKVPTCAEEGEITYVCTICSAVKTETLPPAGHDWDEGMITRHPTAEEDGEIVYVCKKCNESRYEVIEKGENLKGDMNSDGKITAADARILLRISARLEPSDDSIIKKGDINKDGRITAADARKILRVSAKLETM